jgi:hypothetical protein
MSKLTTSPIVRYGVLCACVIVYVVRMRQLWLIVESDDLSMIYLAAKMLLHHQSPYNAYLAYLMSLKFLPGPDQWDKPYYIVYPPSAVLLVAPMTLVRYQAVTTPWFLLNFVAYSGGVFVLIRSVFAKLPWQYAVSISLLPVLGTYFGFCILCTQFAAVLAGLVFVFVAGEITDKRAVGWICGAIVICVKPTFALPIVGLYLLQRRYKELASLAALFVALNLAGFLLIGHISAIHQWQNATVMLEREPINVIDPRGPRGMDRTDVAYLAMGIFDNVGIAKAVAYIVDIVALAIIGLLAAPAMRLEDRTAAICAATAPLTLLTLMCVYHQRYDLTLIIGPAILYAYLIAKQIARLPAFMFLVVVAIESIYDTDRFQPLLSKIHFLPVFFPKIVESSLLVVLLILSLIVMQEVALRSQLRGIATSGTEPALAKTA